MKTTKRMWLTIILFGSIWGGLEAVVTSSMSGVDNTLIPRSAILAMIAVLVLTYARLSLPGRGTTLAVGAVAAAFKFLGLPDLYGCQLAAVIGQAVVLEAAFSLAQARGWMAVKGRMATVLLLSGYINALLFCFAQAYVFGNPWWLDRGVSGLFGWVANDGTLATFAGLIGAGVAWTLWRVMPFSRFAQLTPFAFRSAVLVVSAGFWTLGALLIRA